MVFTYYYDENGDERPIYTVEELNYMLNNGILFESYNGNYGSTDLEVYSEILEVSFIDGVEEYDTCVRCGEIYLESEMDETHPNEYLCPVCMDEYLEEQQEEEEEEGNIYKNILNCYDENAYNINLLHSQGLGVELELSKLPPYYDFLNICNKYNIMTQKTGNYRTSLLTFERDGSVEAELKTVILNIDEATEILSNIAIDLKTAGARSHNGGVSTGLHIHLSRNLFNSESHMLNYIKILQDNIKFIKIFSRRTPQQLKSWCSVPTVEEIEIITGEEYNKFTLYQFLEDHHPSELYQEWRKDPRYNYINVQNDDTIEIRINRGTLKPNTIKATLLFYYDLIEFTKVNQNFKTFILQEVEKHEEIKQYLEERQLI